VTRLEISAVVAVEVSKLTVGPEILGTLSEH